MFGDLKTRDLVALGCLAASLGAPGAAQAQQLVTAFTPQNVITALEAVGVQGAQAGTLNNPDGTATAVVRFNANGLKHNAGLEVCNTGAPGCLGLHLMTVWNMPSTVDVNVVNAFNGNFAFSKAVAVDSNVVIARYVISDGGISSKNIQENIKNHVALATEFANFYASNASAATISLKTNAGPSLPFASKGIEALTALLTHNDLGAAPDATAPLDAAHVSK
jgi:hypothetical protein